MTVLWSGIYDYSEKLEVLTFGYYLFEEPTLAA